MLRSLLLLTLAVTYALVPAYGQECATPYGVGFRVVDLREGRKAAIWYPTQESGPLTEYAAGGIRGRFSRDARPLNCNRPLLVFSHGLGGCGTQSLFLTEELARAGFVVIAPDHRDAACSVDGEGAPRLDSPQESLFEPEKWTSSTYVDRKDDIAAAIDVVLSHPEIGKTVDGGRIGMVGHSLGGYAALGVAGAWREWRDDRIDALVLLSPYLQPFQAKNTLQQIDVPVMLQGADFDIGITPALEGPQGAYRALAAPRYFVKLRGGSHFEWTNLVCLGAASIDECLRTKTNARLINDYAIAFLHRYFDGRPSELLVAPGDGLRSYERAVRLAAVSAASFESSVGTAPESIVSVFAEGLAEQTTVADSLPLPKILAGVKLTMTDSAGNAYESPLFFAGPNQLNALAPGNLARGPAMARVVRNGETVAEGSIAINRVAPGVFSATATGQGVAAATFLRVLSDGSRRSGLVFDAQTGNAAPLDVSSPDESVYVSIFGTGLRAAAGEVAATIDDFRVDVAGPVPHPEFAGLDQLNLGPLPPALAGRGLVEIQLSVGSIVGNATQILIR